MNHLQQVIIMPFIVSVAFQLFWIINMRQYFFDSLMFRHKQTANDLFWCAVTWIFPITTIAGITILFNN